jgi:hypothetical protein
MRSRLLNRASMAAAIDAESDILRHPRDPTAAAAARGFWRSGIVAGFTRRLPPASRVWIRGGVRLALHTASGSAHFERSRDLSLVPGLCLFVREVEMVGPRRRSWRWGREVRSTRYPVV